MQPVRFIPAAIALLIALGACSSSPERQRSPPAAESVDLATSETSARAAYEAQDWAAAERHYTVLVEQIPQDADYWFRLGNIYARTDRPDLAIRAYRETLVRDAEFAKAWFNMGIVQLRQAANSFLKMEIHVAEGDPMRAQAERAYRSILTILDPGEGEPPTPDGEVPQQQTAEAAEEGPEEAHETAPPEDTAEAVDDQGESDGESEAQE